MIPGWPCSFVAALELGRASWIAVLDAARPGPDDNGTEVTAGQVREVIARLIEAGRQQEGDPAVWWSSAPAARTGGCYGVSAIACGLYPATMGWPGVPVAVLIGMTVPDSAQAAYAVLP